MARSNETNPDHVINLAFVHQNAPVVTTSFPDVAFEDDDMMAVVFERHWLVDRDVYNGPRFFRQVDQVSSPPHRGGRRKGRKRPTPGPRGHQGEGRP